MTDLTAFPLPALARAESPPARFAPYRQGGKRALDLLLLTCALPVVLPLLAGLALLVARDGGGAFYGHVRVGRDGRSFRCWKLRTMLPEADLRLGQILAADGRARAEWRATQKLRNDPRVTALGRVLRRTSLDELPQLWNVARGEMSLVGPRPVTAGELTRYGPARAAYLSARPGLTGLWQVSGRNSLTYEARIALDLRYLSGVSLRRDLAILARTLRAVAATPGH